jgi:anti-sigma factor RsiW
MNCGHFQEDLYDFLDDTLAPAKKAAAEEHLRTCGACRDLVQGELALTETLSTRLERAVEPVALDAAGRRKIAEALRRSTAEATHPDSVSFLARLFGMRGSELGTAGAVIQSPWRLALPVAAAALLLVAGIWVGPRFLRERSASRIAPGSVAVAEPFVAVHASDSVPVYTFQNDGNYVVDAITIDMLSMDGSLPLTR